MHHMKTRKPGKLYTFQNTQANHLLGVRLIDWLQYCTMGKYSFSPGKGNKTTVETEHDRTQISINYANFYVFMNQAVSSHSQGSQRREEGEESRWDNSPLADHHSLPGISAFFPLVLPAFSGSFQLPSHLRVCEAGKPKGYMMTSVTWPKYFVSFGDQSCSRTWSLAWPHWWAKDYEDVLLGSPEEAREKKLVGKSKGNLISHGALYAGGEHQETHLPRCARGRLHLYQLTWTARWMWMSASYPWKVTSETGLLILFPCSFRTTLHSTFLLNDYSILKREQSYNSDSVWFFINWHNFEPSFLVQGPLVLLVKCYTSY